MKIGLFASLVLHAQWQQLGGGGFHLVEGLEARELYDGASSNAIVEKKPGLRGVGQRELKVKTCSKEKRVQVYRFCIEGSCDAGANGEHRLKLDGQWLWGGFENFREGQCHPIYHPAKTVAAWKSLTVGTEEHDSSSENDSWFATMTASDWYSETCETYEVILAKQHAAEKKESMCWEAEGVDLGLTATRCSEWTKPSESFLWYLKVAPKDYGGGGGGGGSTGTCGGGNRGNGVCPAAGECCSEYGWCGSSAEHCGGSSGGGGGGGSTGTCGGGNRGNGVCPAAGECCSEFGWCGSSAEHCGGSSGGL